MRALRPLVAVTLACATLTAAAACATPEAAPLQGDHIQVDTATIVPAQSGDTALYATFVNTGDRPVTVKAAMSALTPFIRPTRSAVQKSGTRLTEEVPEGFTIAPGKRLELTSEGQQLTLLRLVAPAVRGTPVTVALVMGDGSAATFTARVAN